MTNEVLHIDDLDTDNEKRVEQYLSKLKVIKRLGPATPRSTAGAAARPAPSASLRPSRAGDGRSFR